MPDVYVNGKRLHLTPTQAIGKGGEADIYDAGGGMALKLFKPPTHADFAGQALLQATAKLKLAVHQQKLRDFPRNLPDRVIAPRELATNQAGLIVGYQMPLVANAEVLMRYADRNFRMAISGNAVAEIFRDLHATVSAIHAAGVVIGDFNDLNVLVQGHEAWLIDADSFQFGPYVCDMFTPKFTDPLLASPQATSLQLAKPHNPDSDWYAYAVMLMNSLLFVDPYGGVYRPRDAAKRIAHEERPLRRITVFDPEVRYPKPAIPLAVLPDDLYEQFVRIFTRDERGEFPLALLGDLRWTTCTICGADHARAVCPNCRVKGLVTEKVRVRGEVKATRVYATTGHLLKATLHQGKLCWLTHENGRYIRENGSVIASGGLSKARFRLCGERTIIAQHGKAAIFDPNKPTELINVDLVGTLPVIDTNSQSWYWAENGQLFRQGPLGRTYIGDILRGQTLFWVGPSFGFGFYRAGELTSNFVFGSRGRGINDGVTLPPLSGQLTDATAVFTDSLCWFMASVRVGGQQLNNCYLIDKQGTLLASSSAKAGDGSWLGTIRGHVAAGTMLLSPTDDGLARVEYKHCTMAVAREYPDTESFISSSSKLLAGPDGLYVVGQREIWRLQINTSTQKEKL